MEISKSFLYLTWRKNREDHEVIDLFLIESRILGHFQIQTIFNISLQFLLSAPG